MDLALLSAGADLSKGIQVYCTASVTRLVLFAIYSIVWSTVFMAPDQIATIVNVTSNIKNLSRKIRVLQEEIPLIYTVKAEIDAYSIFYGNYKYDDGKAVIFLPNSVFNNIIDGKFDGNNFLDSLKSVDSLEKGFFGLGSRKYTLLAQLKNKLLKSNQDSGSYLETHDVFINSCEIKKREKSAVDFSTAKKIDDFCSCWEGSDEELSKEEQDKIKDKVEETLGEILGAISALEDKVREVRDLVQGPSKFFPRGYPKIGSYQVSDAISSLNPKTEGDNISNLNFLKTKFEDEEGIFDHNNTSLGQDLNSILQVITTIMSTYENAKNGQFDDEEEAKKFDDYVNWLIGYLNKPLSTIGSQDSTISEIQSKIGDTKEILENYNNFTIIEVKGVLNDYNDKLEKYDGKIKSLEDSIKDFQGVVKETGDNFTKKVTDSTKKIFENVVECSRRAYEALEGIEGLRIVLDIATLNIPDLISHPDKIQQFQDKVLTPIIDGNFSFISYYSPELSMPKALINKVTSLPISPDELINQISGNIKRAIDNLVGNSATTLLNDIVSSTINEIQNIGNNIGEQILQTIALSTAGALIKGVFTFGVGTLLGIIQGVITTAVQSFISKIVTDFIVKEIGDKVVMPLIEKITNNFVKAIVPKELLDAIFNVIKNLNLLIPRLIGQLYPHDYLTFNRYHLQEVIRC